MSEREGRDWPTEGKPVAAEVSERLRSILGNAESAADAIRHEAESDAQARRRAAETEALKIIEDARREAERFLAERINQVSKLSDDILERGQSVVERLGEAEQVRAELAGLVRSLGETAGRLANEVRAMPGPQVPDLSPSASTAPAVAEPREPVVASFEVAESPPPEPEPEVVAEPEGDEDDAVLVEPTPLRRGPAEASAVDLDPVTEEDADAEPEDAEVEPSPEEAELLERVRAAERERAEDADRADDDTDGDADPEPVADTDEVVPDTNGNGGAKPDLVEVAASVEEDVTGAPREAAGAGPDQALGARLVALQMAVAGGNRGEVESHLRRAFDLDEPGSILDDIFGSGTDAEKRVVWPEAG